MYVDLDLHTTIITGTSICICSTILASYESRKLQK